MPALTDIDPQGELVRRILALEGQVRQATQGREPRPLCQISGGSGVALGVGSNNVALSVVDWQTPGWGGALPLVTFPVAGVYLVQVTVPFMSGATTYCILGFGAATVQVATQEQGQQVVGFSRAFQAGDTAQLTAFLGSARTPGTSWTVNIVRLADVPELT